MTLSVALCTYNGEGYIEEQLLSILGQTLPVDEVVVCDDGSSDGTIGIIEKMQRDGKVKLHRNEKSLGVVENFKKAASLCMGDIIFFADQDDRWHPNKVETILEYFDRHPQHEVVFTDALIIDSAGEHLPAYGNLFQMTFQQEEQRMYFAGLELESFLARNHATGATMAVRKRFLDKAEPFNLCTKQILHDYALALRAAELGVLGVIKKPLIDYRRHDKGQTVFEIPVDGKASKWHTYYDHLRELWPNGEIEKIQHFLTGAHSQQRIAYIATRNKNMHNLFAPFTLPFRLKTYRTLYGSRWCSILQYDIVQCIRYSSLRLMRRNPSQ